jgi:PTS system nitrogen regulatory IIA component
VGVRLADALRPDCVIAELSGSSVQSVLLELARPVAAAHGLDPQRLAAPLLAREKLGSTGVGEGVAVPHCKAAGIAAIAASFGRSRAGLDFRAIDGRPSHLFVALFAPERGGAEHLQALARVSRLLKRPEIRKALLDAPDAATLHRLLLEEDARL